MAVYISRKCWSCHEVLEGYTRDYRAIGVPFVQCRSCHAYNRYEHINEWDLKTGFNKVCYIGVLLWTIILYAMIGPMVAQAGSYFFGWNRSNQLFYYSYGTGLVVMIAICTWFFVSDVKQSRLRLRNPAYLETLRKLQII